MFGNCCTIAPIWVGLLLFCPTAHVEAQTWKTLDVIGYTNGTYAMDVYGNTVVGYVLGGFGRGFVYNGSSSKTFDAQNAALGTLILGVSGSKSVGLYGDAAPTHHGFVFDGANWTTLDDPMAGGFSIQTGTEAQGIDGGNIVGKLWRCDRLTARLSIR